MRVLHVVNQLGGAGGAEQGLVREVTRFGPDVDQRVVRAFADNDLEGQLEAAGIPVIPLNLGSGRAGWNWPLAAWKILQLIREYRPDVVHTTLFYGNLVGQLAAWLARVPTVSTLTLTGDMELHRQLQPGADTWRAAMLRWIAWRVGRRDNIWYRAITNDVKLTNTRSLRVAPESVEVIPRGVDLNTWTASPDRERFGLPKDVPLLVNVGRQTAQKGHLLLIEAFAELHAKVPDAHLVILGRQGEATPALQERVRSGGLERRVHLLGYRTDVPTLLASADVFVFSSLAEGLGTAVLEAMAAGLPVVAFDIPPVREISDGGRVAQLVTLGDTAAFARQIERALDPDFGGSLAKAGSQWVSDQHDIEKIAKRVLEYLRRVARRR